MYQMALEKYWPLIIEEVERLYLLDVIVKVTVKDFHLTCEGAIYTDQS